MTTTPPAGATGATPPSGATTTLLRFTKHHGAGNDFLVRSDPRTFEIRLQAKF